MIVSLRDAVPPAGIDTSIGFEATDFGDEHVHLAAAAIVECSQQHGMWLLFSPADIAKVLGMDPYAPALTRAIDKMLAKGWIEIGARDVASGPFEYRVTPKFVDVIKGYVAPKYLDRMKDFARVESALYQSGFDVERAIGRTALDPALAFYRGNGSDRVLGGIVTQEADGWWLTGPVAWRADYHPALQAVRTAVRATQSEVRTRANLP